MWLSTWDYCGTPAYAEHATEADAKAHAEMKRQGGVRSTWFWSEMPTEESA